MSWADKAAEMRKELRVLNKTIPDTTKGFSTLTKAAKDEGPLDTKTREMIAIALSVAERCEPCIGFHVEAFLKAGGTREELSATLAMVIQMGGGPALMYSAKTLDCFDEMAGD